MIARRTFPRRRSLSELQNLGYVDRTIRAALALGLIGYLLSLDAVTGATAALVATSVFVGMTAACGWDPFYRLLGWCSHENHVLQRLRRPSPKDVTPAAARRAGGERTDHADYRRAA